MNDYQFIDGTRLSSVIEAIIFASEEPVSADKIVDIIARGEEELELEADAIHTFVDKLNRRYDENGLAFEIRNLGGGYTFATRKRFEPWLSIFQHEDAYRKLSQAAIETLAIVAYKQPITKPEVDDIRGVDSGYILRQLLEKVLIEVAGRMDAPGKPLIYRTSRHFLKHFGINSLDELPKPREIEEILQDDDMSEHRQFLFDRQLELERLQAEVDEDEADIVDPSLVNAVEKLAGPASEEDGGEKSEGEEKEAAGRDDEETAPEEASGDTSQEESEKTEQT
ncbi:MAG: SMC-Scp complex subunit ScpB [Balneolaceae bacterium]|nr:SMC-Scp complex subunit ScpB [Balneolaceae bacterium]